jgi:hypothetical protein
MNLERISMLIQHREGMQSTKVIDEGKFVKYGKVY